ncbi:MAG: hypothetical protein HKN48_10340 [Flavobacteriaceae bacterium]|nr:hypothetical protein [Flavobacteriaceae bacterium]
MKKSILLIVTIGLLSFAAYSMFLRNDATKEVADNSLKEESTANSNDGTVVENSIVYTADEKSDVDYNIDYGLSPDFFLEVGPRLNTITKEELGKTTSFADFIAKEHAQSIVSYKTLDVILLDDTELTKTRVDGKGGNFSEEQLNFLKSFDYSTNILIWAEYTEKDQRTGLLQDNHWTPYLTIVPETQAEYKDGHEALLNYLTENTAEVSFELDKDKLKPGRIYFTITQDGKISNVKVNATCGFDSIDKLMINLIRFTSGKWESAKNAEGEKVNQDLVISFGRMGC